jgi:hypothetical protein
VFERFSRRIRLAKKHPDITAEAPGGCKTGIERDCAIDQRHVVIKIVDDEASAKQAWARATAS